MLTAAATKTKPIGNYDNRQFTIVVNSASIAALIGLSPKMAKFCYTSNRLLLGRQRCHALLQLYFNSSAVSCWLLVIGHWSLVVGCWTLVVGHWSLVVGCWLLAVGCWLLVVGCWLLVVGCWLLVVGPQ
jgi:hypothetical protein